VLWWLRTPSRFAERVRALAFAQLKFSAQEPLRHVRGSLVRDLHAGTLVDQDNAPILTSAVSNVTPREVLGQLRVGVGCLEISFSLGEVVVNLCDFKIFVRSHIAFVEVNGHASATKSPILESCGSLGLLESWTEGLPCEFLRSDGVLQGLHAILAAILHRLSLLQHCVVPVAPPRACRRMFSHILCTRTVARTEPLPIPPSHDASTV
jgi:hypothetical protein